MLPIADFTILAHGIGPVVPSLRAEALISMLPGSALPRGFLSNEGGKDISLELLYRLVAGLNCVQVTSQCPSPLLGTY